ncbi:MAG TPA: zeta toxin family protein [Rhabdochlamydiaceae bacterium]
MKNRRVSFIKLLTASLVATAILGAGETTHGEGKTMSGGTRIDVCDVNRVYDKAGGFEYSVPRNMVEGFLSGKAFDNPEVYSGEEAERLHADINEIYERIMSADPVRSPLAVITAGAPGAGKTIKMRQELDANSKEGRAFAYIDPDDVCLRQQTRTYQADIAKGDGSKDARLAAYNKWRPGSNAANHLILANLIREKCAFYFGTTATSPATFKFLDFLKKHGYQIKLIHVSAPDDVRWQSIRERDKEFVQTTEKDTHEKGLLLPQRISDTFLAYADEIEFYYRDGVKEDAQLAATWVRNSESTGALKVVAPQAYDKIKAIHNSAVDVLQRPELRWESTVEKASK